MGLGARGSGLQPRCFGRWRGLPRAGPAALSGGPAQTRPGRAGLGRGPQGLWTQGTSPRATSAAGAGGSAVQTRSPRPGPRHPGLLGGRDHPRRRQRGNLPSPRPGGAAGSEAPPGPGIPHQHHHPEMARPQPDLLRGLQTPNALHPPPTSRLGPTDSGHQRGRAAGALFQRPENGNCAKRIPKSGRARSPPAYIKPQEPPSPRGLPALG